MLNGWLSYHRFLQWLRSFGAAIKSASNCCLLCEAGAAGPLSLCANCRRDLPWNETVCPRCALPMPADALLCADCATHPPLQTRTVAPLRYAFPVDRLVTGLKFQGRLAHAPLLGNLLLEQVCRANVAAPDLLLPVPLHTRRLTTRGYNQALEIARPLARHFHQPLETRLIQRCRSTDAQMTLDANARAHNLHHAFQLDAKRFAQLGHIKRVALIDDVMTTGATLHEVASLLHDAGIAEVEYWVAARTL